MDKTKFVVNPHLDSEGFLMADARCRGCGPDEMCPRSGHCERYDSPLRDPGFQYRDSGPVEQKFVWLVDTSNVISDTQLQAYRAEVAEINEQRYTAFSLAAEMGVDLPLSHSNPKGWDEVDGVQLPPINWADYTDDELQYQFEQWQKAGRTR